MNTTWDYVTLDPSTITADSTDWDDENNLTDLNYYIRKNTTEKVAITDHTWPIYSATIITCLYVFVIIFAIGGNAVVCYVVLGFQRMRTVTNYFIVNLAFSDIMMAILCIPFSFVANTMYTYWPFGPVLCPVVTYCQTVSVFLSCLTLVAIAIDRYVAIIHPLKPRLTVKQAFVVIAIIWVLATGVSLPVAILSRIERRKDHRKIFRDYCTEIWQSSQQKYNYSLSIMLLQYFIPLSVFVWTYIRIGVVIWVKKPPGEAENNRDRRMNASKRKMIKMMMTVVFIYAICWLPVHTITLVGDWKPSIYDLPGMNAVWVFCHWLSMSNSCYNPIIYCWMNAKYRQGFKYAFRCFPCCRSSMDQDNVCSYNSRYNANSTYVTNARSSFVVNKRKQRNNVVNDQPYVVNFESEVSNDSYPLRKLPSPDSDNEDEGGTSNWGRASRFYLSPH